MTVAIGVFLGAGLYYCSDMDQVRSRVASGCVTQSPESSTRLPVGVPPGSDRHLVDYRSLPLHEGDVRAVSRGILCRGLVNRSDATFLARTRRRDPPADGPRTDSRASLADVDARRIGRPSSRSHPSARNAERSLSPLRVQSGVIG